MSGDKDIGYLIKNINDKLKVKADNQLKEYDLTMTQSRVFAFLESKNGLATQKEIEVFLDVSHPTVVGIVSRMEKKGYLRTWIDEEDKRNKMVQLTEKALGIGTNLKEDMQKNEQKLLSPLSNEEVKSLREILIKISNHLD